MAKRKLIGVEFLLPHHQKFLKIRGKKDQNTKKSWILSDFPLTMGLTICYDLYCKVGVSGSKIFTLDYGVDMKKVSQVHNSLSWSGEEAPEETIDDLDEPDDSELVHDVKTETVESILDSLLNDDGHFDLWS